LGDSLRDSFASRGFDLVENCLIIKEEYRQRVEAKVWEIFETHLTIAAIRNREAVTDLQLVALEGTLRQELGGGNVQLSQSHICKTFNLKANS
jgi:type I restriction enzyme R subunit